MTPVVTVQVISGLDEAILLKLSRNSWSQLCCDTVSCIALVWSLMSYTVQTYGVEHYGGPYGESLSAVGSFIELFRMW